MVRRTLATTYRMARRIVVGVIGGTVVVLGVVLLVLPGPASLVIPLGLGILGLEFAFARRWLRRFKDGATELAGRFGGSARPPAAGTDIDKSTG